MTERDEGYERIIKTLEKRIWRQEKHFELVKEHILRIKYEPNHFPISYDGQFLVDGEWTCPKLYWEELLRILNQSSASKVIE